MNVYIVFSALKFSRCYFFEKNMQKIINKRFVCRIAVYSFDNDLTVENLMFFLWSKLIYALCRIYRIWTFLSSGKKIFRRWWIVIFCRLSNTRQLKSLRKYKFFQLCWLMQILNFRTNQKLCELLTFWLRMKTIF